MIKLPLEILTTIFLLLHQRDKLECMTVCHQWAQIIERSCLFHTIRVSSMRQMENLMEKVRQKPSQGARVVRLLLDVSFGEDFEIDQIALLFPNVRVFLVYDVQSHLSIKSISSIHSWRKSIEHLAEEKSLHGLIIKQFIASGLCPRLKHISLRDANGSGKEFIKLLVNTPLLKTLCICSFQLTLLDFELLHESAPSLNSLTVDYATLDFDEFPSKINPATSMKTFKISNIKSPTVENEVHLLKYISEKYTNLVDLYYDAQKRNWSNIVDKKGYNDELATYMQVLCARLQSLSISLIKNKRDIDYYLGVHGLGAGANSNDGRTADTDGIRTFTLCPVTTQPFPQKITWTNLFLFVNTISINYFEESTNLKWLKDFTVLKDLTLYNPYSLSFPPFRITLMQIMNILGETVETLRLKGLTLSHHISLGPQHPLKSISFDSINIPSYIDGFMSHSFPKLNTLIFLSCDLKDRSFILPNVNLTYFMMKQCFTTKKTPLLEISLQTGERRWYSANQNNDEIYCACQFPCSDATVYPAVNTVPFDKYHGSPCMTLACNSVKNIYLFNTAS